MAQAGADRVVGLDLNPQAIDFAREDLRLHYPELLDRVEFHCQPIETFPEAGFDYVVSRAAFEHVMNLDVVMAAVRDHLRTGGRLLTGFDPLWPSPYGGHRIHRYVPIPIMPWGHLLFPESLVLKRANQGRLVPLSSLYDFGLNKLSIGDYRRIFQDSGLSIVSFRTNYPASSWKGKLMSLLAKVRFLEKYVTYSVYAILEKKSPDIC